MASFLEVYCRMISERESNPIVPSDGTVSGSGDTALLDTGEDTKSMEVIRAGLSLDKNFWHNFIKICANDGLADLLNIKNGRTSEWASRIKDVLEQVEKSDKGNKRNQMLPTGDVFPKTIGDRNDDGAISYPNDTNPTP